MPGTPKPATPSFRIIAIGASAGGIRALRTLFQAIPEASNSAFVIVQHRLSGKPDEFATLIRRWTALQVREALDGVSLECGCVYIAPAGTALTLEKGVFATQSMDGGNTRAGAETIDRFYESLARDAGARAVAVVLSGTGTDGAAGAMSIRHRGGMVFVQDPATCEHEGMPATAIATGAADGVLGLERLAQQLVACAAAPPGARVPDAWVDETHQALGAILEVVRGKTGIDLAGYKTTPLLWRIQRRMDMRGMPTLASYEALLHDERAEVEALVRGIPIHVTGFFRDAAAWDTLASTVLPALFAEAQERPIRAWTTACASGEEAYSLAMLLDEHAGMREPPVHFRVFATDVSIEILGRASRGAFKPAAVKDLPPDRLQRYFYLADGAYRVRRFLRETMVFAPHDLLSDAPFPNLDLITCRNLFIYLDEQAVRGVVELLHASLRPGGYLFLGKGESLSLRQPGFEEVALNSHIYRKTGPMSERQGSSHGRGSRRLLVAVPRDAEAPRAHEDPGAVRRVAPGDGDTNAWSDALRLSNEELDASHEELLALNEELRATNDQLNKANEELAMSNARLVGKIQELQMQSDVLISGAVMSLFLDEDLRIRWYTPAMDQLFPIQAGDLGRPITDLLPAFEDPTFLEEIHAVIRSGEASREGEIRSRDGRWYIKRMRPFRSASASDRGTGVAITFADITDRRQVEQVCLEKEVFLRRHHTWLSGQREAFQQAMNGAPLDVSLGVLANTAVEHEDGGCRCAFYLTDPSGSGLHHLVGMPPSYARQVNGLAISPESLDCGLAVATGSAVVTRDVTEEPRWQPWVPLAREYDYRGVWSFPIETSAGRLVGSLAFYFREPRAPTPEDSELVASLVQTAAIIISRYQAEERARALAPAG